ncbi:MAG: phenylacetate--CoA ligase family protein, partial [Candidatus Cloacimonetes bacterium]|nr:phenylacetate--CoA ligase family protein [Candidatus Cloacimonadota bacterium]
KETVRTRARELTAENSAKYGINWDSTSGSTGTPLHFISDDTNQANKIAALLRSYHWAGYRLGDLTLSLQSYYLSDRDFIHNSVYNVIRFDSNRLSRDSLRKLIGYLKGRKPKIIMGFPFDLVMLVKTARDDDVRLSSPKGIIVYGETLSSRKREILEDYFGCHVYNFYSLHENAAMISECEAGNLHLLDDFACHEMIENPESGGYSLVGTGYYNYAMPFIRYNIKDSVILSTVQACPCGRPFPLIETITGKECDYLETTDGRLLGAVMSHSIDNARGVICSQCIQYSINNIEVKLVTEGNFTRQSQQNLERDLRKRLGSEVCLSFSQVSELEKTGSGKTPFIISKIGHRYF